MQPQVEVPEGVTYWKTVDGINVLRVHYSADPDTRVEGWLEKKLEGYPGGKEGAAWRKEMEIDFSVFGGKKVYPEFSRKFHVANSSLLPLVIESIRKANTRVIVGWDNTGLSPAAVLTIINTLGQWLIFKEFCGDDIEIVKFGNGLKGWCGQELPAKTEYRHIGDPAGKTRDSMKMSPAQYLNLKCGIQIETGIQIFKVRRESVAQALRETIMGEPKLLIDPSCVELIAGFDGGYNFPEIGSTGMYNTEPEKNMYSHIHDALQYPATRLFTAGLDRAGRREIKKKSSKGWT
jgi:hypothetical protein